MPPSPSPTSSYADEEHSLLHPHAPRSTPFESFSTTFKCIVGSGLMSLPFAFAQSGWLVGTLCMLAVGAFSLSTMRAMIDAVHLTRKRLRRRRKAKIAHSHSRRSMAGGSADYGSMEAGASPLPPAGSPGPDSEFALDPLDLSIIKADPDADIINYQQVGFVCYGEKGRIFTDAVLIFTQLGSCSAFLLLVLGNLQAVLGACGWSVPMEPIALVLLPVIALLAIPRSTTFLAGAAHFGNFTMLVALATIVFFGLTAQSSHVGAAVADRGVEGLMSVMAALPAWGGSLNGIAVFFGISAFSFAAHCEVVAVEADAQSRQQYAGVLTKTMAAITALYVVLSVFAFACFGDATSANIMLNLGSDIYVNLVRVTVSCTLLVNIAMALLPASQTLDLILIGPAPISTDLPHQYEPGDANGMVGSESSSLLGGGVTPAATPGATPAASPLANGADSFSSSDWPAPVMADGGESGFGSGSGAAGVRISSPGELMASQARDINQENRAYHRKGNYIRIAEVVGFVVFALLVRNLSIVFSLVGSIAGGILCFSMPPAFAYRMMRLERQPMSALLRFGLVVQILFGFVLIALGLVVIVSDES